MQIPAKDWYGAIRIRRSRRIYDGRPLDDDILRELQQVCTGFRPFPGARAVLVDTGPERVFKGAVGNYGKVKNAPAHIAFIGDMRDPHVHTKVGYMGQGIVLAATHLGLATCWVGALFRKEVAQAEVGAAEHENVLAVTPVGFVHGEYGLEERVMSGFGRYHRRREVHELTSGQDPAAWPKWVGAALSAARLAPSAMNRQPWRFTVEEQGIRVSVDNLRNTMRIAKRIDCGIAMLHLEVGALFHGVSGTWQFLDAPQVALFKVSG